MPDYKELYFELIEDIGKAIRYLDYIQNKSLQEYIKSVEIEQMDENQLDIFKDGTEKK